MVDAVMIRANSHEDVERFAQVDRAGDQRPDRQEPPLPDHGRPDDHRGASRPDRRQDDRLGRRRQQRLLQLHPRRAAAGLRAEDRLPGGLSPDLHDLARAAEQQGRSA
jgi:hypothetical protein